MAKDKVPETTDPKPGLKTYHVCWDHTFRAETPEDAARQALALLRNPDGRARLFLVRACDGRTIVVNVTN